MEMMDVDNPATTSEAALGAGHGNGQSSSSRTSLAASAQVVPQHLVYTSFEDFVGQQKLDAAAKPTIAGRYDHFHSLCCTVQIGP